MPLENRLEALHGDRRDRRSIRVNEQQRTGFVWRDSAAHDVESADYHGWRLSIIGSFRGLRP